MFFFVDSEHLKKYDEDAYVNYGGATLKRKNNITFPEFFPSSRKSDFEMSKILKMYVKFKFMEQIS